jgi:hypothetical protein
MKKLESIKGELFKKIDDIQMNLLLGGAKGGGTYTTVDKGTCCEQSCPTGEPDCDDNEKSTDPDSCSSTM